MWRASILCPLLLAACEDRRSFDERYTDTQQKLENKARDLDATAAATDRDPASSNEAGRATE